MDSAIKESHDRVTVAIHNSGFHFPPSHITVNLAAAHIHKAGSAFDLPIGIGVLAAMNQHRQQEEAPAWQRLAIVRRRGYAGHLWDRVSVQSRAMEIAGQTDCQSRWEERSVRIWHRHQR